MKKIVENNNMDEWEIIEIKKDKDTASEKYYHLIIDPYTAGIKTWEKIEKQINIFLADTLNVTSRGSQSTGIQ